MRGTFFGIEIGRTGITLGQLGLDVTGHNIANVETRGYTRQRIVQTAHDPFSTIGKIMPVAQARVGGGTKVKILDQIRSAYLDRRFRTENATNSYWGTRTRELSYLESFFDNVNEKTSINHSISKLFAAMKVMAEDPVEGSPRKDLQTAGLDLVQQLNTIYDGLMELQATQNKAVEVIVDNINLIAAEIVELNKAIYGFELTGHLALDLRDKRNVLLDELSAIIEIQYDEYTDAWGGTALKVWFPGTVHMVPDDDGNLVPTASTMYLVDHYERNVLDVRAHPNAVDGEADVWMPYWVANVDRNGDVYPWDPVTPGTPPPDPPPRYEFALNMDAFRHGELKALMDMRDNAGIELPGIPYYIEELNNLARALVAEINAVHRLGWTDPPLGESRTGVNFFHEEQVFILRNLLGNEVIPDGEGGWLERPDPSSPWVPVTDPAFDPNNFYQSWVNAEGNVLFWDTSLGGRWIEQATGAIITDPAAAGYTRASDPDRTAENLSKITIKNIRLSDEVMASEYNIASSTVQIRRGIDPEDQQRGNNENMRAMFNLFAKNTIAIEVDGRAIGIGSFDSFATSIRVDVGRKLNTAKNMADASHVLTLAAEMQRTSVAGVSLDEEMTNLIRYNHAYNGASRVVTAMDDLLDRLINGTGRVGL